MEKTTTNTKINHIIISSVSGPHTRCTVQYSVPCNCPSIMITGQWCALDHGYDCDTNGGKRRRSRWHWLITTNKISLKYFWLSVYVVSTPLLIISILMFLSHKIKNMKWCFWIWNLNLLWNLYFEFVFVVSLIIFSRNHLILFFSSPTLFYQYTFPLSLCHHFLPLLLSLFLAANTVTATISPWHCHMDTVTRTTDAATDTRTLTLSVTTLDNTALVGFLSLTM